MWAERGVGLRGVLDRCFGVDALLIGHGAGGWKTARWCLRCAQLSDLVRVQRCHASEYRREDAHQLSEFCFVEGTVGEACFLVHGQEVVSEA